MQDQKTHFREGRTVQAVPSLFLTVGLLVLCACALDAATSGRVVVRDRAAATVDVRIDGRDRGLIEEYYRNTPKAKNTPPGLAKRDRLPPGLAKRDRLPPGLQGRGLPADLETRLSPLPRPYIRLIIGADIIVVNQETRVISDIVPGVVR